MPRLDSQPRGAWALVSQEPEKRHLRNHTLQQELWWGLQNALMSLGCWCGRSPAILGHMQVAAVQFRSLSQRYVCAFREDEQEIYGITLVKPAHLHYCQQVSV